MYHYFFKLKINGFPIKQLYHQHVLTQKKKKKICMHELRETMNFYIDLKNVKPCCLDLHTHSLWEFKERKKKHFRKQKNITGKRAET